MKRRFYSTSEVARMCNVHRNTIIAAIRQGKLPAFKTPGGHARISHHDLVRFCKERGLPIARSVSRNDKILVLDKDPFQGELLKGALEHLGYRVRQAVDGFEAGVLSTMFVPDVFILDLEAPSVNSELVCSRLRNTKVTQDVFVLGIAQQAAPGVVERAYAAGLDDLLERPFELPHLLDRITQQVGGIDVEIPIKDESHFELRALDLADR